LPTERRITTHPILSIPDKPIVSFTFNGETIEAKEGEMISSALIAAGIDIFGHHTDGAPQGIFCANGQCAQCLVIANNYPVKGCMTPIEPGMIVKSVEGIPHLPEDDGNITVQKPPLVETDVLILGGGPAGLAAAIEFGKREVKTLIVDDKSSLGGKLVLQTHKFFGSMEDCYAGTRGIEIAEILSEEVTQLPFVEIWLNSTALAVFADRVVGVLKGGSYFLVKPKKLLVATGAREKMLSFPGNTLPGVYGAGAFQTLVNRDLIKSAQRVFIVGGGNVGLIAGYHAIQAGIDVVGLVEALPKCGGYLVHEDKLRNLGVPIYTRHTIVSANGADRVESVTISEIDEKFHPIAGTEFSFEVDTVLIAVGLESVDEFYIKAKKFGMGVWAAGDANEIAEASAAMFSGRIQAMQVLKSLGIENIDIPKIWIEKMDILKSPAGKTHKLERPKKESGVFPVFHCHQEIPCDPCTSVCSHDLIQIPDGSITSEPVFIGPDLDEDCTGCGRCIAICPGLAITLVDYRKDSQAPRVTIPLEMGSASVNPGDKLTVVSDTGEELGEFEVQSVRELSKYNSTQLVRMHIPKEIAASAAGFRLQQQEIVEPMDQYLPAPLPDTAIVCRCERVTAGEIREWIKKGVRDSNQLKGLTRTAMGACGAKTCTSLIDRLFRDEGVSPDEYTPGTRRPLFVEVPLGAFSHVREK
jgi:NADPH-dependent 2,4-dienoyl-CoA reductase/sulfur reductase-like enzyme/Fe-S-cluster-containing hydrogenase component 2/bacterioferritin-associated ferredoxin